MKMEKIEKILMLDCTKKENIQKLKLILKKLPMFKDQEQISINQIEKYVWKICFKYDLQIGYIMPSHVKSKNQYYSIMLKKEDDHQWLKTIYCKTIYEGFAKLLIYLYAYIKEEKKGE